MAAPRAVRDGAAASSIFSNAPVRAIGEPFRIFFTSQKSLPSYPLSKPSQTWARQS
jgi:hypothetical protein